MPDNEHGRAQRIASWLPAWMRERFVLGEVHDPPFTGSCPVREHTGDGHYVGRCEFATYGGFCPRHGALDDYPTNDDREVRVEDRRHAGSRA